MKHEWRKAEKALYLPGTTPTQVTVPEQIYLTIDGEGDPNTPPYQARLGALFALSYAIRMMPKKGIIPEGYFEYAVYPLEGVYDQSGASAPGAALDKSAFVYRLMIRQPDFVTEDVLTLAREIARKKKPLPPMLDDVSLRRVTDGPCVQALHLGSYDDEPETFSQMQAYLDAHGLVRAGMDHREIYLNAPPRATPERLRTVLRYRVKAL